jgi:hypothetical protein
MNRNAHAVGLADLPPDVMLGILSYLTAREVETKMKSLSKAIW